MAETKDSILRTSRDAWPEMERFRIEVLAGLRKPQKEVPSKYLYDEKGSQLFEMICTLDEYYIPSSEAVLMERHINEVVELIGPNAFILEYGSGNCRKVCFLLDHLHDPVAYAPIDISREQLSQASGRLIRNYPWLEVLPVCADYTCRFELPVPKRRCCRHLVYFPGSTISNFDPRSIERFLEQVAGVCGPGGGLLIGVDLKKDPVILHQAYNDRRGVTADFNLNLLERINRELGGNFKPHFFRHYAFYHPGESRVEMHLISTKEQMVHLGDEVIPFSRGESIWTESSYKFNLDDFARLADTSGFRVEKVWTDEQQWFSIQYLTTTKDKPA
ncbi:MAG: L-histidine N(alpha)-methyltransferase [bacterium]